MRSHISQNTDAIQIPIKTNKRSDRIMIKHINAQCLIPKLDETKLLIENEDPDMLCISGTWLQPNILETKHSLQIRNVVWVCVLVFVHSSNNNGFEFTCLYAYPHILNSFRRFTISYFNVFIFFTGKDVLDIYIYIYIYTHTGPTSTRIKRVVISENIVIFNTS